MRFRGTTLLALILLLCGAAHAFEITFQVTEVDVGQGSSPATGISGNEWATFGALFDGGLLFVYGPADPSNPDDLNNPDPFAPGSDNNGIFEGSDNSFEIEFLDPAANVEIDWFALNQHGSTITAFNPDGAAIQVEVNPGGADKDTEVFPGPVKRIVVEATPAQVCIANIRFEAVPEVPLASPGALFGTAACLLLALGVAAARRGRHATSS